MLVWYYREYFGRTPNIADPQRYSERMLWRKILDRNPQFVVFSDKLATKDYIKKRCPDLPVPGTLWVGDDASAIPDGLLAGDVYLKANHGCNFNRRVRCGQPDRVSLREETGKWLTSLYGHHSGEWSYSRVEPQLFVEESIGDQEDGLMEIQIRASNGTAIAGSVMGRCKLPDQWWFYLDPQGSPTIGFDDPEGSPIPPIPPGLNIIRPYLQAVKFAERLSVGVDYARFDFMWNGTGLFGGEITVYPSAGLSDPKNAVSTAALLSGWDLSQAHFLKSLHPGWMGIYAGALKRSLPAKKTAAQRRGT